MDDISELANLIRRERPKPETAMADALVNAIEAVLKGDDVIDAADRYVSEMQALVRREILRDRMGVEVIG